MIKNMDQKYIKNYWHWTRFGGVVRKCNIGRVLKHDVCAYESNAVQI